MIQTSTPDSMPQPYPQTILMLKQVARMYRTRQRGDGSYALLQPN